MLPCVDAVQAALDAAEGRLADATGEMEQLRRQQQEEHDSFETVLHRWAASKLHLVPGVTESPLSSACQHHLGYMNARSDPADCVLCFSTALC
jgi:hypothetical protein